MLLCRRQCLGGVEGYRLAQLLALRGVHLDDLGGRCAAIAVTADVHAVTDDLDPLTVVGDGVDPDGGARRGVALPIRVGVGGSAI